MVVEVGLGFVAAQVTTTTVAVAWSTTTTTRLSRMNSHLIKNKSSDIWGLMFAAYVC
jgi:hypothetical protein